jgi:long-subunit fatty acid transport protein
MMSSLQPVAGPAGPNRMHRLLLISALLLAAVLPRPAAAQGAPEVGFSSIPFQFFPPGARSLAMGATFVGIADDATAAASNPAGLVILTQPEASAHGRFTRFSSSASGGYTQPSTSAFSPSYVSAVLPVKPFSLSAYYQQVSNIDLARTFSGRVQFTGVAPLIPFASASRIDLLVADLGLSAGAKVGDRVSVGATLARRSVRLTYLNQNTITGDVSFTDRAAADKSDQALVFNAGVLVNPNGRLSVGAVYKRGGRFAIPYEVDYEDSPKGPVSCPLSNVCEAGAFSIPDTWGLGAGFRPSSDWLFAADFELVRYSQLSGTIFRAIPFDIYPPPSNELPPSKFDDVLQLHGGVERIFSGRPTVGLRAGVYHRPNFNKGGGVDAGATFVTFGVGLVFGDRGQLDFAGSLSGGVNEGLASFVVRF